MNGAAIVLLKDEVTDEDDDNFFSFFLAFLFFLFPCSFYLDLPDLDPDLDLLIYLILFLLSTPLAP